MPTAPAFTPALAPAPRRTTVSSKTAASLPLARAAFLRGRAVRPPPLRAPRPPPSRAAFRLPLRAAAASQSLSVPAPVRHAAATAASLALTVCLELAAARALSAAGVAFPASLAAMLSLLGVLTLLRFLRLARAAAGVRTAFAPAAAFLARWLAVFFVPNLVMLPLAPRLPAADVAKIGAVLVGGLLASLLSTAGAALLLRAAAARARGGRPVEDDVAEAAKPSPPSGRLVGFLALATAASFPLAAAEGAAAGVVGVYMLAATVLAFCLGQRLPRSVRAAVHPLVSCTAGSLAAVGLLASVQGAPFAGVLARYYVRDAGFALGRWGAGNVLAALLGPAVVSFAIQMDGRRRLMRLRGGELVGTALVATTAGLFGTAAAARALGMSEGARLMVVPRMITAPLALAIADMLGAEAGIALSVVALTGLIGANIAAPLLSAVGVRDPVVRGLATGAAAHGLGTAAMADEPAAFPFAAVAMTLVGIFSTCFVAYPPIRALLLRVALGAVKIAPVA